MGSAGATGNAVAITVIGASSAAGKNLDEPMYGGRVGGLVDSWPNRNAAFQTGGRPGSTVRNLAVAGYNTFHALPTGTTNPSGMPAVDPLKNITAALTPLPDAIIVAFPSQAQVEMGLSDQVIKNLHTIVNTAAAMNVPVWVATTQPQTATMAELMLLRAFRDRTQTEFPGRAIDFWTPLVTSDGLTPEPLYQLTDGNHPNAEGQRVMFEQVKAANIPAALGK
jgi:hypothetical protein